MIQFNNFNKAIIVSGDGDFFCLVEYLVNNNKLLNLFTPNMYYSKLYKPFSGYIVRIDWLKDSLKVAKKRLASAVGRNLRPIQSS